jgi:hypothetical protein
MVSSMRFALKYCYHLLPSLNMNPVPEKLYLEKSNAFALAAKQERKCRQRLTAFLLVTNVHINYISNHKL